MNGWESVTSHTVPPHVDESCELQLDETCRADIYRWGFPTFPGWLNSKQLISSDGLDMEFLSNVCSFPRVLGVFFLSTVEVFGKSLVSVEISTCSSRCIMAGVRLQENNIREIAAKENFLVEEGVHDRGIHLDNRHPLQMPIAERPLLSFAESRLDVSQGCNCGRISAEDALAYSTLYLDT